MIRVDGDSMSPTLSHGDEIMVDRMDGAARLRDGIYVLRMVDTLMVKRVALGLIKGKFSIRSDNPNYPVWEDIDPALVHVISRVICTGRRVVYLPMTCKIVRASCMVSVFHYVYISVLALSFTNYFTFLFYFLFFLHFF